MHREIDFTQEFATSLGLGYGCFQYRSARCSVAPIGTPTTSRRGQGCAVWIKFEVRDLAAQGGNSSRGHEQGHCDFNGEGAPAEVERK